MPWELEAITLKSLLKSLRFPQTRLRGPKGLGVSIKQPLDRARTQGGPGNGPVDPNFEIMITVITCKTTSTVFVSVVVRRDSEVCCGSARPRLGRALRRARSSVWRSRCGILSVDQGPRMKTFLGGMGYDYGSRVHSRVHCCHLLVSLFLLAIFVGPRSLLASRGSQASLLVFPDCASPAPQNDFI
jgi:hypothetical protein